MRSSDTRLLPNGQALLFDVPEADEGRELLMTPEQRAQDQYPLSTLERDQERLQQIIHLVAADAPLRFICRAQRVGWHTLESIRAKHGVKIAAVKKTIAQRMSTFVQLGIEQLLDDLVAGKLDSDKLGVTLGIVADKLQILTGEATSIVANIGSGAPRLTADSLKEKLRSARNVTPTGSNSGEKDQPREAGRSAPLELIVNQVEAHVKQ